MGCELSVEVCNWPNLQMARSLLQGFCPPTKAKRSQGNVKGFQMVADAVQLDSIKSKEPIGLRYAARLHS
jgi:hypothetical protein